MLILIDYTGISLVKTNYKTGITYKMVYIGFEAENRNSPS